MGTNYYAHILPKKQRRQQLHDAIEADDFRLIKRLTSELYGTIDRGWNGDDSDSLIGGVVHLGKRSGGWKFCWNPNVFVIRHGYMEYVENSDGSKTGHWVSEPNTAKYLYPLTKQGIKDFIDRKDVLIYNEYDELQDKEEFWQMALSWGYEKDDEGWDAASYEKEYPNHNYSHDSDLVTLLEKEGYKFTSWTCSDFYSDGLRFASFTDFC